MAKGDSAEQNRAAGSGFASALLGVIDAPALLVSHDGTIIGCNRACLEHFATTDEQLIGRCVWDLPEHPDAVSSLRAAFADLAGGECPDSLSGRWGTKHSQPVDWTYRPVSDETGEVRHVLAHGAPVASSDDPAISRERAALLQSIINTSPEGVVVIDKRGIMRDFSPSAIAMFGYEPEDVLGRNVSMLMPEPYREGHDGYMARYFETGEKRIIGKVRELVAQRKDGTIFPIELMVDEVFVNGMRLFTGFIRDISLRKETEQELRKLNAELIHTGRVAILGEMASAIAHEINQPLTAISNYIAVCRHLLDNADADQDTIRDVAGKVEGQVDRAREIIRHFRSLVRKGETDRQNIDVNAVVQDALALAFVGVHERGIATEVKLAPSLPPVMADAIQIQQVILNLVRNAIEALAEVKERELSVATAWDRNEDLVKIGVHDSGPGIAAEIKERLFQPFMTTKEHGMGIGLSLCRSIITSHDGRLWAEDREPHGTSFWIALPSAAAESDS